MVVVANAPDIEVSYSTAAERLLLKFPYNAGLVALVKTLPDRRYHPELKVWSIPPAALGDLQALSARAGVGVALSEEVRRGLGAGAANRAELRQLATTVNAEPVDLPTATVLYPYQHGGVRFLLQSLKHFKGTLLADDMGLGKTLQALSVEAISPRLEQVLVLCPATLKYTWAGQIDEHYPQLTYTIIDGEAMERRARWQEASRIKIASVDCLVCTCQWRCVDCGKSNGSKKTQCANEECKAKRPEEDGTCPDFAVRAREWDIVIVDECKTIKNWTAQRSKNVKKLLARYRLGLSGKPLENRLEEVHSIMDFAVPGLLGSGWSFVQRYCVKDKNKRIVGYKGISEIREKIRPHYLRRLKGDVLTELPPKTYTDVRLELSRAEWLLYDAVVDQIRTMIEENPKLHAGNVLTLMLRLIQIAADARLVDEDLDRDSTKTAALKDILDSATGHQVVAFTQFAQYAHLLGDELRAPVISGKVKVAQRAEIVKEFQAGAHPLLLSTEAGAYGITLTAADIVLHLTQPWNPAVLTQREDRLHRIGQQANVQVISLIAQRTIDEHVRSIIHAKRELAAQVFEEGAADELNEQQVTRDDLLAMLGGR